MIDPSLVEDIYKKCIPPDELGVGVSFKPRKKTVLSPISRQIWSALPKDVRDILENQHGYNHYNPETDNIESDNSLLVR